MPGRALEWFHRAGQKPQEQPPRVDYYLDLGEHDSLGIKLREGRIEIKQREAQHGTVHLGPQVAGVMERWRKWSWALAVPDSILAQNSISSPVWIGVEKERWLLLYQTGLEGEIAPAPDGGVVEQGCQVELSRIQAQDQVGWSLSFESFGGKAAGREMLLLVAAHLFSREAIDLRLSVSNSYGYPKWLAMLGRADPCFG
ncbi:MAG: hypothetical protein ACK2UU_19140 [Anaerolineae bacterium]